MDTTTSRQRVADQLLGQTHDTTAVAFVLARREMGVPFPRIAADLARATDGQVTVTAQALRNWVAAAREQAGDLAATA